MKSKKKQLKGVDPRGNDYTQVSGNNIVLEYVN